MLTSTNLDNLQDFETFVQTTADELTGVDRRDLLTGTMEFAKEAHIGYFRDATGPNGSPWQSLAPQTRARKAHGRILIDQTNLFGSIADDNHPEAIRRETDDGWEYGTSDEKSEFHNQQNGGGGGKIPQRIHVGWSEELLDKTLEVIADNWLMTITIV